MLQPTSSLRLIQDSKKSVSFFSIFWEFKNSYWIQDTLHSRASQPLFPAPPPQASNSDKRIACIFRLSSWIDPPFPVCESWIGSQGFVAYALYSYTSWWLFHMPQLKSVLCLSSGSCHLNGSDLVVALRVHLFPHTQTVFGYSCMTKQNVFTFPLYYTPTHRQALLRFSSIPSFSPKSLVFVSDSYKARCAYLLAQPHVLHSFVSVWPVFWVVRQKTVERDRKQ